MSEPNGQSLTKLPAMPCSIRSRPPTNTALALPPWCFQIPNISTRTGRKTVYALIASSMLHRSVTLIVMNRRIISLDSSYNDFPGGNIIAPCGQNSEIAQDMKWTILRHITNPWFSTHFDLMLFPVGSKSRVLAVWLQHVCKFLDCSSELLSHLNVSELSGIHYHFNLVQEISAQVAWQKRLLFLTIHLFRVE